MNSFYKQSNNSSVLLNNTENNDTLRTLKIGVWVYIVLLIFEGALRKWVLPGLATPLLIVRDPVAIWLLIISWKRGVLTPNIYLTIMLLIGVFGIFTAVLLGHGSFVVALYGARIFLLQFPMIFIIGSVFDRNDILKIGKFLICLSIPMSILLIFQFYSPQSAWVNRGVGGDAKGGGFSGALGYFRAPTTFSFTNGTSLFFSLVACFVFYFWIAPQKNINRFLLIGASMALMLSIPFSISRGLLFSILVTGLFVLLAVLRKPKYLGRILITIISMVVIIFILGQLNIFNSAIEVFTSRFTSASETEGGLEGTLGGRYIGDLINAFSSSTEIPFFGYGIGLGTNAGGFLINGTKDFTISEGEWGRVIGEMGLFFGIIIISIRLIISCKIAVASYKRLIEGDFLPWILLSFCLLTLPQAQWAQPTALGFSVFVAGAVIAATRVPQMG